MVEISNEKIEFIENEILWMYREHPDHLIDDEFLLPKRKELINEIVLAHQEELLPDIIAFNDALTDAMREMYDRVHQIWDSVKEKSGWGDTIELTAKCFLGREYPKQHPVQGEERQELWDALCDSDWNPIYDSGVKHTLDIPRYENMAFESFIGMDCPPPNWNEGLDQGLTKDLHLTSAFHNLFDHMEFAITDFIYVRKFETEINIEIRKAISQEDGKATI